jgi:hypothetical protein
MTRPRPPRWEAGDQLHELWCGQHNVVSNSDKKTELKDVDSMCKKKKKGKVVPVLN